MKKNLSDNTGQNLIKNLNNLLRKHFDLSSKD